MAVTVFKDTTYSLTGLLDRIEQGEIALPDIQRPFVWQSARVRELFDSMYKGFPVGYLLFWSTGAEVGSKQIGTGAKMAAPQLLIVDGQQRLTSLYAVIKGATVVKKDYSEGRIRIAFRPSDQTFDVTDAAIERDPEFIPDISVVFQGNFLSFANRFIQQLEDYRGVAITSEEADHLVEAIDRLKDLQNYPFKAMELDTTVGEESVAEVFVRINSEGVKLNQADFILTLMSVFWEKGRLELEEFARRAKAPSTTGPSPFNHFVEPSPDQVLRTSVGLAFRRGRLQHVYSLLRGKDLETGEFSTGRRDQQFAELQEAHDAVLNLTNWHEFLKCLTYAGYRSSRMISSETAVFYTYILWLIGKRDFGVETNRLRAVIGRWWFMAQTTGRYTGSSETQIEADLGRIRTLEKSDPDPFCALLDRIVADTFTNDYWEITLPNRLDTSSPRSPALYAYWAALNTLGAELLFSDMKVSEMLDPAITPVKNIERHHLFPKAYLAGLGVSDNKVINAIANMSFVDWTDNNEISAKAPSEYWPDMAHRLIPEKLKRQQFWHALPIGWEQLEYDEFCEKRRLLIARVIQEGFEALWSGERSGSSQGQAALIDLVSDVESNTLEFKSTARWNLHTGMKDPKMEQVIVKAVCGFMNGEGGTLLVGVADDGTVLGLKNDYSTLGSKQDSDGFELFLRQLVDANISGPASTLVRVTFGDVGGLEVCKVEVAAAAKPVFAKPQNSSQHTDFWVRMGNLTKQLHGSEMLDYQQEHWG